MGGAFSQWWQRASALLPAGASHGEYHLRFLAVFPKAKVALGANALEQAVGKANSEPLPTVCEGHDPRIAHLLAVCWHLSAMAGGVFFLSVRDAASVLKTTDKYFAAEIMGGLVNGGVLQLISRGTSGGRKASRYRFHT